MQDGDVVRITSPARSAATAVLDRADEKVARAPVLTPPARKQVTPRVAPRPAPAPAASLHDLDGGCTVCGRHPAMELTLRRHLGLFVVMKLTKLRASFCREHGEAAANEYLRRTMVEGWWGFLSFFLNWIPIVADMRALRLIRRLPPPIGAVRPDVVSELPDDVIAAVFESADGRSERRSVLLTVTASIVLSGLAFLGGNILTDAGADGLFRDLGIGIALSAVLYALVAVLVAHRRSAARIRSSVVETLRADAIGFGALIGAGAAVALAGVMSLIAGRPTSDARIVSVIFEGHGSYIFVMVFLALVAAPFIEEVLFRGLLLESLRSRGRTSAVLGAAVAFSLWHVDPAALRYYVLMGFLLGYVYWRFGLAGSISAHVAFNGVLVVMAFVALSSPSITVGPTGVSIDLPAGWHQVDEGLGPNVDLAFESPVGSAIVIEHLDVTGPPGTDQPVVARLPHPNELPVGATNMRTVIVSQTTALRFTTNVDGLDAEVVLVPSGSKAYAVTLVAAGSEQAQRQFDPILASIALPFG